MPEKADSKILEEYGASTHSWFMTARKGWLRHRLVKFTSGTVVLDGVGTSFSRVFGASDVDRLQVTFYCDCNGNGALNVGESFAGTYIWVQPLTIHAETVKASTLSGFTAGSQVRSWADASLQSARRKDTNSDFRSCFDVTISSFATFVPSTAKPDPADTVPKLNLHVHAVDAPDFTMLDSHGDNPSGYTSGGKSSIALPDSGGDIFVHELGHQRGLLHTGLGSAAYIMDQYSSPEAYLLTREEADAFD